MLKARQARRIQLSTLLIFFALFLYCASSYSYSSLNCSISSSKSDWSVWTLESLKSLDCATLMKTALIKNIKHNFMLWLFLSLQIRNQLNEIFWVLAFVLNDSPRMRTSRSILFIVLVFWCAKKNLFTPKIPVFPSPHKFKFWLNEHRNMIFCQRSLGEPSLNVFNKKKACKSVEKVLVVICHRAICGKNHNITRENAWGEEKILKMSISCEENENKYFLLMSVSRCGRKCLNEKIILW